MTLSSTSLFANDNNLLRQHILVAEDNGITGDLMVLILISQGHRVDLVSDGELALNALLSRNYSVVFLDFHLPKLDGDEVLEAYRQQKHDSDMPRFVAITADMEGFLARGENTDNFDFYLPKPFSRHDINTVVEK